MHDHDIAEKIVESVLNPQQPLTQKYMAAHLLSRLGTGISIYSGQVKQVIWAQTFSLSEMMHHTSTVSICQSQYQ